jgi:hypothetical protein
MNVSWIATLRLITAIMVSVMAMRAVSDAHINLEYYRLLCIVRSFLSALYNCMQRESAITQSTEIESLINMICYHQTLPHNNHHKQQLQWQDVDVQPTWMTKALARRHHQQLSPLVDTAAAVVDTSSVMTLPLGLEHQQSTDAQLSIYPNCMKMRSSGRPGGADKNMIIDQASMQTTCYLAGNKYV